MNIAPQNYFQGKAVYFDTRTKAGRDAARVWHEKSGAFYDDRPRLESGAWFDADGTKIEDIETFEEEMVYAFGYIYDLLVTLHQCKVETASRRAHLT